MPVILGIEAETGGLLLSWRIARAIPRPSVKKRVCGVFSLVFNLFSTL